MVWAAVCTALHSVVKLFRSLYFRWQFLNSYVDLWQRPCHTVSFCVVCRAPARLSVPFTAGKMSAHLSMASTVNLLLFTASTMPRLWCARDMHTTKLYLHVMHTKNYSENDPNTAQWKSFLCSRRYEKWQTPTQCGRGKVETSTKTSWRFRIKTQIGREGEEWKRSKELFKSLYQDCERYLHIAGEGNTHGVCFVTQTRSRLPFGPAYFFAHF